MKYIQKVGKEIGLLLFCFLIMILLSSLYLLKDHQNIVNVIPEWNDEHFYYNQIMAMLKYGRPLGYYGYEGSHALFGNYGAHGFMILVPYALFALFAGFRYNTIAIVNHFLFAIAIYVYWKLLKPSWLKLITLIMLYWFPLVVFYENTCMLEGMNYHIALMSAVLLTYMKRTHCGKRFVFLYLVFASLCKVTWVILFVPFLIFNNEEKWTIKKALKRVILFALLVFGCYSFYKITSANYFEGIYTVERMPGCLQNGIAGVHSYLQAVAYNFKSMFNNMEAECFSYANYVNAFILLAAIIWLIMNEKTMSWIPAFVLGGFWFGIVFLYTGGAIAVRSITPAAVFALAFMIINNERKLSQILFLIIVVLIMLGTVLVTRNDGYQSRQYTEVVSAENVEKQRELTDHIVLDERANPWDNTVLIPLSEWTSFFELQLPIGAGIQYYYNVPEDKQTINEGWIILQEGDNVRQLQKAGFKSIYNKEGYVLMRKTGDRIVGNELDKRTWNNL